MFEFLRRKSSNPRKDLKGLLDNYEVQSFPGVVTSILGMLRDPESSITEIAEQIEMDPGLHVKILRLVNSVSFGLMRQVSSLNHAVTLLGRARLESMVLSFAVAESLAAPGVTCIDNTRFWLVAVRRAGLARMLALHLHAATQGESYTAALLQDIALPVLSMAKKDAYCALVERWNKEPGLDLAVLEKEAFGYDHAQVGALIAQVWGLPDYLVNAVGGHHGGVAGDVEPAVRLVSSLRYSEADDGSEGVVAACVGEFRMEEELIRNMLEMAFEDAEKTARIFA